VNQSYFIQTVNIGLVHDTYNFSSYKNRAFLLMEATVCCRFYYWSEAEVDQTRIIEPSAYTSMIKRLLLKSNGRDLHVSMHHTIGFTIVMW